MGRLKREHSGFTMVELVLAMGIIVLIAAIAMPRLMGARKKATEVSAMASIKAIQTAESLYQSTYPAKGYSATLTNLGSNGSTCENPSPSNACLIDEVLASGLKDGYIFDLLGDGKTPDQSYTLTATPVSSASGECTFTADQSGNIQVSSGIAGKGWSGGTGGGNAGSCDTIN